MLRPIRQLASEAINKIGETEIAGLAEHGPLHPEIPPGEEETAILLSCAFFTVCALCKFAACQVATSSMQRPFALPVPSSRALRLRTLDEPKRPSGNRRASAGKNIYCSRPIYSVARNTDDNLYRFPLRLAINIQSINALGQGWLCRLRPGAICRKETVYFPVKRLRGRDQVIAECAGVGASEAKIAGASPQYPDAADLRTS